MIQTNYKINKYVCTVYMYMWYICTYKGIMQS